MKSPPSTLRSPRGAWSRAAFGLVAFGLLLIACGDDPVAPRPRQDPGEHVVHDPEAECRQETARLEAEMPPEDWWGRRVPTTLLISGGLDGSHKPCGCSGPQLGGLERLAALRDRLVQRGRGNVVPIGVGWFMGRVFEDSHEEKGSFIRDAYDRMGFQGLLLGDTDLRVDSICQPFEEASPLARPRPPLNMWLRASHVAHETMGQALLDLQAGSQRLRFASLITDPAARQRLLQSGVAEREMSTTTALQGLNPDPGRLWVFTTRAASRP